MDYYARFINSTTKAPLTGLTPAWTFLIKGADGTAYTPQPAFTELGNGLYRFTITPTQDILGKIDGGAALALQDRYAGVSLAAADVYLDAAVSSRSTLAAGEAMTLTGAYDAAKTAASQASVDAVPTAATTAAAVWASGARTLTSFGALVSDIAAAVWAAGARTLTAFGFTVTADTVTDKTGYALDAGQRVKLAAAQPDYAPAKASDVAVLVNPTLTQTEHDHLLAIPTVTPAAPSDVIDAATAVLAAVGAVPELQDIVNGVLDAPNSEHVVVGSVGAKIAEESAPILLPLVYSQGSALILVNSTTIEMKQRNSYRLPFNLERDCTGWAAYFGAKSKYGQTTFDIVERQATFTDQANGVGYVDLTAEDMDVSGVFHGELQLRQGEQRNSPESYTLNVKPTVFTG